MQTSERRILFAARALDRRALRLVYKPYIANLKTEVLVSVDYYPRYSMARKQPRYQIWDINCLKDGQMSFVKSLDTKGAINIFKVQDRVLNIMIEGTRTVQVEKLLKDRGIPFEVTNIDAPMVEGVSTQKRWKYGSPTPIKSVMPSPKPSKLCIDWSDYYPLSKIYQFIDSLETLYPSICSAITIGKSVEGRDIKILKISNSDVSNTGVWMDGCTHAREWISGSVVTYIADQIAQNFDRMPKYITNKDWYLVPIVNPDGYYHTHTQDRMWRKNRARFGKTIVGVDINRNFSHYWGQGGHTESSGDPMSLNFRGSEPFSEPETAAIKDLILYSGTPFKIFLTYHSYSEVISFPWCYTADPCADYVNLLEGATTMAKAIYETNGRMYKVGNFKDIMYSAAGTSIDWSYGTARIPFTYLVELRSKQHKFLLPKEEILGTCTENYKAVVALSEYVDKYKCSNCDILSKRTR